MAGNGDSGAAVYSYAPGFGVNIRGMFVAYDTSPQHIVPCRYWWNLEGRRCADKIFAVSIQRIEANWAPSVTKVG